MIFLKIFYALPDIFNFFLSCLSKRGKILTNGKLFTAYILKFFNALKNFLAERIFLFRRVFGINGPIFLFLSRFPVFTRGKSRLFENFLQNFTILSINRHGLGNFPV